MFTEEGIGFSKNFTVDDYLCLDLNLHSDEEVWNRAIDIFADRLQSRYLDPIEALSQNESNAFAIMAIESLLLEVFLQFKKGFDQTPRNKNRVEYVKFIHQDMNEDFVFISDFEDHIKAEHEHFALCEVIPFKTAMAKYHRDTDENFMNTVKRMSMDPAERFYCDIRCGILHSGQTKGESVLCFDREHAVEIEKGILYVSVDKFIRMTEQYFGRYLNILRTTDQTQARKNFMKKMNCICYRPIRTD